VPICSYEKAALMGVEERDPVRLVLLQNEHQGRNARFVPAECIRQVHLEPVSLEESCSYMTARLPTMPLP
jgi:hypothetical protein